MGPQANKTLIFTDSDCGGIIHVANIKGGVGKSTVATNLGAALSRRGPTLVIDLDVQGSATHALGKDPSDVIGSSWDLMARRFSLAGHQTLPGETRLTVRVKDIVKRGETMLMAPVVGRGDISSLCLSIAPGFDLIPASAHLFKYVGAVQLHNLLYNLDVCRTYYKYIVIDTPSVWNKLTTSLFLHCDLNLIPVTLNALSTRSLRDYLIHVRRLAQRHRRVRLRIVKNEVFGKEGSKIKGKTRTMNENRRFLESLCEQTVIRNDAGVSLLPQSILFELEIPESAAVRDAQDEGKSLHEFHQYAAATKAFDELARHVQYVLNTPLPTKNISRWRQWQEGLYQSAAALAALLVLGIFAANPPASHVPPPRPLPPQQLSESPDRVLRHVFTRGESMYRMAKHAISCFAGIVPSASQVEQYVQETILLHNQTRIGDEIRIEASDKIPAGLVVTFLPPFDIINPNYNEVIPAYRYFIRMVKDPYAYITGDWCERGTGGGTPHYGMDVAAVYGSPIIAPINGVARLTDSKNGGRSLGIVKGNTIVFFAHMDKRYFKDGTAVNKGDTIGTVGMTGNTSGPHAHIGYGVRAPGGDGSAVHFGKQYFKLTDPKLFFYREQYIAGLQ